MAKKKVGRPHRRPMQKCPRCGKLGWPQQRIQKRYRKDKTYTYTYTYFTHYDRTKKPPYHMIKCYISKKKMIAEEAPA